MRAFAFALLVASTMAGCSGPADDDACPDTNTVGTVVRRTGTDVEVGLSDGQPAVLHLAETELFERIGDGSCGPGELTAIEAGDEVRFEVDVWAESYPQQGWPSVLIVA